MAKKKIDTSNDILFDHGVDTHSRTIILNGEVNDDLLYIVDIGITHLEKLSSEPINIRLSTCGGSVYAGNAIIDRILTSSCEVHIHAYGEICSMGVFILASGHYRSSGVLTILMHHEDSYNSEGRHSHNKNYVKAMEALDIRMCKWLASRTKKDFNFWKKTGVGVDHWFSADQALEYGLIDEVIE